MIITTNWDAYPWGAPIMFSFEGFPQPGEKTCAGLHWRDRTGNCSNMLYRGTHKTDKVLWMICVNMINSQEPLNPTPIIGTYQSRICNLILFATTIISTICIYIYIYYIYMHGKCLGSARTRNDDGRRIIIIIIIIINIMIINIIIIISIIIIIITIIIIINIIKPLLTIFNECRSLTGVGEN